ncbi:hypothetical protein [Bilophila wadsworthia]|uniref:hypothetical protein n=1 Tax=Bilophila wadsworthia TaxID=35833 RepID=UPI003990442E
MTPSPPFRIVPWDTDFLDALKNGVMKATRGQPGNAVVVFMHDRPRRYLRERFRYAPDVPKPCLIPRMFTERELMAAFRQEQHQKLRREAGKLDQIALLSRCVRELAEPDTELCMQLAKTDDAGFFPWGVRLAELLEECFTQGLTPEDMLYTEGEVAPFGAALLGSLGKIFRRYRDALIESDLTTPGFDAFVVASALEEGTDGDDLPPLPDFLAGRAILLAGFGMLTGTENTLFRYLWRHGAQVFLHVDPALAENGQGHWACTEQSNWIADWKADTVLACPSPGKKPKIHYFAGYDLHSQLDALRGDLSELERKDRLAAALKARSTTQQLSLLPSSENGTASTLPETSASGNADNKDSITSKVLGGRGKGARGKGEGSPSSEGFPLPSPVLAPTPPPSPPRSSTSRWPSRTAGLCCPCCTTCPARTATFRSATRLNARSCSACWKPCSRPATAASPTARPTGRRLRISSATRTCACLRPTAFPCATSSKTWKPASATAAGTPTPMPSPKGLRTTSSPPPPCPTWRRPCPPSGN